MLIVLIFNHTDLYMADVMSLWLDVHCGFRCILKDKTLTNTVHAILYVQKDVILSKCMYMFMYMNGAIDA